jgi:ribosomal-protein-alanine N-acetyltransferase
MIESSTLSLRHMELDDVPQVVAIDRESFSAPWSARSYAYEVSESSYSYMLVLAQTVETPVEGWRRWLHLLGGDEEGHHTQQRILGYGGLWKIMDEAHISTIASHPDERGKGYGELLLAAMIKRSITLGAGYVVLEVRVSNTVAQNLYHKYEFEVVAVKKNYYRDDREDAYDMRLDLSKPGVIDRLNERFAAATARFPLDDTYTNGPRRGLDR